MAINYPVDVAGTAGRWYLYDTATTNLTLMSGTGDWPNADGSELIGLEPNFVPILATDDPQPAIDERLHELRGEFDPPDVPNNSMIKRWTILDRPDPDRHDVVDNIESEEWRKHYEIEKTVKDLTILVAGLIRFDKSLNIPAPMQTLVDKYQTRGEKVYQNRLKIDQMHTDIDAGQDPVLDQEFEPAE